MSVRILIGDVRARLAELPDESVNCVVTSPPYWGLRDYGIPGQLGMERTHVEHVETMVEIFRLVRRALRPDGTVWLNYGDCYASQNGKGQNVPQTKNQRVAYPAAAPHRKTMRPGNTGKNGGASNRDGVCAPGLKPKDLVMMPNRVAIALQDDGWWVRSEIIWAKPNPMPESVTDRPACAHEKVWLLTKSARYWYDADSVRTEAAAESVPRALRGNAGYNAPGQSPHTGIVGPRQRHDKQRGHSRRHAGFNDRWDAMTKADQTASANLRNVWTIATAAFPGAHFATFPPALVEPCIKAGCPKGGVVLDPFGGSGTVGMVADRLGRDAILIEINPAYAEIAERRIKSDAGMFAEVSPNA